MKPKKRAILLSMVKSIEGVLEKIDKENELFINSFDNLTKEQKKISLKGLEELEKILQAFFIAQKKDYLKAMKELPVYLKKRKIKYRIKVKKADGIPDDILDQFVEVITDFVFANDKRRIEQLEEIYAAYSGSVFPGVAEICARSVEGSKLGNELTLTDMAVKWLEQHKIKFAQEVTESTHNSVIRSLKNTLTGANGIISGSEDLISVLPDFFKQTRLKQKSKNLTSVTDVDLYNKMSQEIEQQACFEHYRARRIARTETINATNSATLEGWRQSDVIGGKQWVCAMSDNSRKSHKKANGQIVDIDKPFIVDGEKLMHPGDTSMGASAENVINCRCTMKSVLKYKMKGRG